MFYGKVNPIIELTYNGAVVGSSSIPFVIDRNPIQIGDVESKSDYPAIIEHISAAEAAAADAKKAVDAEAVERADGDAKTLSDARAYTDSSVEDLNPLKSDITVLKTDNQTNKTTLTGLVSDNTTIKSNITTLQSDVASLKTDNTQNKTDIATKQDKLVSGTNIKTINGESILGSGNITISGGSGSEMPPLYSHTITLKDSGNSAYFTFTIYVRTDEVITKNTLLDNLSWDVCVGTGVVSNSLIDKITFDRYADNTWVHQFLELSGQHIDKELRFDSVFGTDFTVEDVVRGPDWIPPR